MGQVKSRNSNDGRHFYLQPNLYEYKFQFPISGQGLFFVCFLFNRNVLNTIQVAFPVLIGKELVMLQKETFMRLWNQAQRFDCQSTHYFNTAGPMVVISKLITDFLDYKVWHFIHHCYFQLDSFKLVPLFTLEQKPKIHSVFVTSV